MRCDFSGAAVADNSQRIDIMYAMRFLRSSRCGQLTAHRYYVCDAISPEQPLRTTHSASILCMRGDFSGAAVADNSQRIDIMYALRFLRGSRCGQLTAHRYYVC